MMALRKASIHPLLFRRLYDDDTIRKMSKAAVKLAEFRESNTDLVFEDMTVMTDHELNYFCRQHLGPMTPFLLKGDEYMSSGKAAKMTDLLLQWKASGDRALVFSQFTMVLDILESVLREIDIKFSRLDGSTKIDDRQRLIDDYHEDSSIPVFLLSTKAGGAGINLACANKVIVFDQSFNPQDDIQAENRAHRVGQTKPVEVIRLVTTGTIEEQIVALGETKLMLEQRVADQASDEVDDKKTAKQAEKKVEEIFFKEIEQATQKEDGGREK